MIRIKGIIGDGENQYSLANLIEDVSKEPDGQPIHIIINSEGGSPEEALSMFNYLRSLGRFITTESESICASAASVLFLAGDERIFGCPIMIHNPWIEVQGDAETLKDTAKYMEEYERKLEKFYAEHTSLDANTLSDLMKTDRYLSESQAIACGFATRSKLKLQALVNKNNNKKEEKMKEEKKLGFFERLVLNALKNASEKDIKALLESEVKSMTLETKDGGTLEVEREEGEPQVGDIASPNGSHTMPDGKVIVVEEGVITEIVEPDGDLEQLKAELERERAEKEDLKAQLESLQASVKTQEEREILNAVRMLGGKQKLAEISSSYKPNGRQGGFNERNSPDARNNAIKAKIEEEKQKAKERRF